MSKEEEAKTLDDLIEEGVLSKEDAETFKDSTEALEKLEVIQKRYNEGGVVTEEEINMLSEKFKASKEEILAGLEESKQDEIEREENEQTDEEIMEEFKQSELKILAKIENGIELTDEDVGELAMIYALTDEEVRENVEAGAFTKENSMLQNPPVVKPSIIGMIINAIKKLFK
jgi:ketosteroid isomerase-like protein